MKLRMKMLIILASIWAITSLSLIIYSKQTLSAEYSKLETKQVTHDLERVTEAVRSLFIALKALDYDWSQWDDAYTFVQNKNAGFIHSNLSFTTFENNKMNLILFFDTSGTLVYGLNYDLNAKKFVPIPQSLLSQLLTEKSFTQSRSIHSSKTGFLKTQDNYVVLSSLPIMNSEGKGPIRGTLVMGYFLTEEHLKELSDLVKVQVQMYPLPLSSNDEPLQSVYAYLNSGQTYYTSVINPREIMGYTFVRDIDGNPIGMLGIKVPRSIYIEGSKTIDWYLSVLIGMGILFLACSWFLIKIFILDRLINVSQQVVDINRNSAFTERLPTNGHDEIDEMSKAINSLMEIIYLTQEQLKNRISLRTEELERLSQLNKNLYAEMSNQRQIEVKLRQGEQKLRHMAYYDALTGLPNRLYFNEVAHKLMVNAGLEQSSMAIIFIDVDKFKSINDTYGHEIGDHYLRHIADQLRASVHEGDVAARLAGDEFLVCLKDVEDSRSIVNFIENMLTHLSKPLNIDKIEISSTFSVGIAIYPNDGNSITDLERNADLAMYYAKKNAKTVYCFYSTISKEITS